MVSILFRTSLKAILWDRKDQQVVLLCFTLYIPPSPVFPYNSGLSRNTYSIWTSTTSAFASGMSDCFARLDFVYYFNCQLLRYHTMHSSSLDVILNHLFLLLKRVDFCYGGIVYITKLSVFESVCIKTHIKIQISVHLINIHWLNTVV